jgi:RNA polymerase sigma factor (sigma-70 family)
MHVLTRRRLRAWLPVNAAARIADALQAALGPRLVLAGVAGAVPVPSVTVTTRARVDTDALVATLFEVEGHSLVRLARLFTDDQNAAEDLVQEAFIRLARSAQRIEDRTKAAAYLRSIVLNLARDHNRRGLVSLRHQLPFDEYKASFEDGIVLRDDQRRVIEALRDIPHRQRDCLVLRYYHDQGIDDIAATLGISPNSVKTHLQRGLAAMERKLAEEPEDEEGELW